jgi:hypothetical protein
VSCCEAQHNLSHGCEATNQIDNVVVAVGDVVGGQGQATADLLLVARVNVAYYVGTVK